MAETRTISQQEALLWLNDRLHERLLVDVRVVGDDAMRSIVSGVGELQHNSERFPPMPGSVGMALQRTLGSMYTVGTMDLDLLTPGISFAIRTGFRPELAKQVGASELVIVAGDNVEMTMTPAAEGVAEEVAV